MSNRTSRRSRFAVAISVAAIAASLGAGSVFAGEINGNGSKTHYAKGVSLCIFSGLNDDPEAAFPEDGRTQSYGQLVRKGLKADFPSPGIACNPNTEFPE